MSDVKDINLVEIGDETELRALFFFVAIAALSLFILCLFFLEEEKKRERESNAAKKSTEFRFIQIGIIKTLLVLSSHQMFHIYLCKIKHYVYHIK